jgi:two-component system, sensor histidine kinase
VIAKACERAAEAFRESLRMRFENAELVQKLAQEKRSAEEANAAKSRFLAAASHDLRQPLHALLVFSTLLHKTRTPQTAELIEHIRSAAGSLDKLFAGLLDLSKLETGGIAAQLQAVNVTAVLGELVREYRAACDTKGIGIALVGPGQWVLSDPFLLERVLRNLIDNAVKYTSSGHVTLTVREGLSQCTVEVADTGAGIPPEMQSRIFEEYFQADNPARDLTKGSGLGLAIVRRLCQLMDMPLEMASQPGQGSRFTLTLQQAPIDDAIGATGSGSGAAVPRGALAGCLVWVVEDNDLVRLATCKALADMGCDVTDWSGVPEDIEHLAPPDALIADYRLGADLNGLQVAARMRQRWPGLPVAIMTGDPGIDAGAIEAMHGVVLLRKPVLPALLERWLHETGRGTGAAPPEGPRAQAILTP